MEKVFYVYIMCSRRHGTLYVGVTNDLSRRVYEHKHCLVPGFTARYGINRLVYYEQYESIFDAITREKQLKRWHRDWKIQLIEKDNLGWEDLYVSML